MTGLLHGAAVVNVTGWHLLDIRPGTGLTELLPAGRGTAMPAETGFPRSDVENDFLRVRRRQVLARMVQRLRRGPDDVNVILPLDEVLAALGRRGERRLGLQTIRLDNIVGTVDSTRDFDRKFRPTSGRVRERWERLALAQRRGESIPPIDVYQVGDLYFVEDGHHRVSIALASGAKTIDAYVTEVRHRLPASGIRGAQGSAVQELRADIQGAGAADGAGDGQDHRDRPVVVRRARRGRGGVGVPLDAGPGPVRRPRGESPGTGTRRSTSRWCA